MELPDTTLEFLQLEAYAFFCRDAVKEKLAWIEREKEKIEGTRPPFGILARKETRDAFTQSMRATLDNEAMLRNRLVEIQAIEEWLQSQLRVEIAGYLAEASPDYGRYAQIRARLEDMQQVFLALPETLVAFARELRETRATIDAGPKITRVQYMHQLAILREIAGRVEKQNSELFIIAGAINELMIQESDQEICLPPLPDFRRVAWVSRLAVLPPEQAAGESAALENSVRAFAAGGNGSILAGLQACREACTRLESKVLELYWDQLRAYARMHYVEETDFEAVLQLLTQRFVGAEIERQQRELTSNPFLLER
jgi:hypothetical protein